MLCLRLPLWGALDGPERIALLGHESVALVVRQGARGGHGPAVWRAGMDRSLAEAAERIDAELARHYERMGRIVSWSA